MKKIIPYRLFVGSFIPNWLLARNEISHGAKLCYARLCQYSGRDGVCYPSLETLASDLGVSINQAVNYIRELKKHKLIEVKRRGLTKTNVYYFLEHEWFESQSIVNQEPQSIVNQEPQSIVNLDSQNIVNLDSQNIVNKEDHIKESIKNIYIYWNSCGIIKHKFINEKMRNAIKQKLKHYTEEEIKLCIMNYSLILNNADCFFKYRWTLNDFLNRGFEKFLNYDVAYANYRNKKINTETYSSWKELEESIYAKYRNDSATAIKLINQAKLDYIQVNGKIIRR